MTNRAMALVSVLALACGDADPGDSPPAGDTIPSADRVEEDPGLPMDSVAFEPTGDTDAAGLTGTLWLASSQPQDADGVSLIAQLEGVPAGQAYSWAIHRGRCGEADNVLLPLGYGTEAVDDDAERSQQGGPLGDTRAAFEPTLDGQLEETVWIPLNGELSRARLEGEPHTLRIHPDAGAGELEPSVACAPIPELPGG